jgi:uncharacterized DUF497 family protein
MHVTHCLRGIQFEWDRDKAKANLAKHAVSFEQACEVFFDPFVRVVDASDQQEVRDAAIGYAEDSSLLFVVHVIRHEETIRIISARQATSEEKKRYEDA